MKIQTADKWFSLYIRLRDSDDNGMIRCCSCGKMFHYKSGDAGHYVNRKHKSLRFSEINVHGQCISCNRFSEGNITGYTLFMIEQYGQEIIKKLEIAKKQTVKFGQLEIKATSDFYRNKAKELAKLKGLKL